MNQLTPDSEEERITEQELPRPEDVLKLYHPAMFANHPVNYVGLWLLMIGGLVGIVWGLWNGTAWIWATGVVAFLFGVLSYGWWYLNVRFKVLRLTSKRTLYRTGILSKKTNEVQHDDVRNIKLDQTFFQRIMNVGDISISSAGQDDMEIMVKGIYEPQEVVDLIRRYQ